MIPINLIDFTLFTNENMVGRFILKEIISAGTVVQSSTNGCLKLGLCGDFQLGAIPVGSGETCHNLFDSTGESLPFFFYLSEW